MLPSYQDNHKYTEEPLPESQPPVNEVGLADIPYFGFEYNEKTGIDEKLGVIAPNGSIVTDERLLRNFFEVPEVDEFGMTPPSLRYHYEEEGYRAVNLSSGEGLYTRKEIDDIITMQDDILNTIDGDSIQKIQGHVAFEALKHAGYKTAELASFGLSKRLLNKPLLTRVLEGNITGIKEIDDPEAWSAMSIARGIQGIGETAGHLVQFMATMNGVGAIFQKM